METYRGEPYQDTQLVNWWMRLVDTAEIADVFHRDLWALGAFMAYWRGTDRQLVICAAQRGDGLATVAASLTPWAIAWYEPMLDGASIGFWVDRAYRRTRGCWRVIQLFHELGLERWPVLVGITKQEGLLRAASVLGYSTLGKIPGAWGGADVWVSHLTREAYSVSVQRRQGTERQTDHGQSRSGALSVYTGDC